MLSDDNWLEASGIVIENRSARPEYATRAHSHEHPAILYVVSGRGSCQIEQKQYRLGPEMVIIVPEKRPHLLIDVPGKAMTIFSIYYRRELEGLNRAMVDCLNETAGILELPFYQGEPIRQTLRQMLYEQKQRPPGWAFALQQHLSLILLGLYREKLKQSGEAAAEPQSSAQRVGETLAWITEHYYQPHSLAEAARMAKLSQRRFSSLCRKQTGRSFVQYLNEIRTGKAALLLKNTARQIAAVAFEVGYEELSTFYRAFGKYQKQKPQDLRRHPAEENATQI